MRRRILAPLALLTISGCDPFAPVEPETPKALLVRPRAESSDGFAAVFDSALTVGDASWVSQLLEPSAVVGLEAHSDDHPLDNCIDALVGSGSLSVSISTLEKTPEVSDTSTRVVEYSIASSGKTLAEGKAMWVLASPSLRTWKLRRWTDDPAYPSSLHRRCAGGGS